MAQLGRALRSGRRGRGFESRRFDSWQGHPGSLILKGFRGFFVPYDQINDHNKHGNGPLEEFFIMARRQSKASVIYLLI